LETAFEFTPLVACKLIVYTFGSLVYLFLMVLILGQRRMRRFEWLLFWLMAGLFMWNSGNLLSLNLGLHYGVAANPMSAFSRLVPFAGLLLALSLLVHVHFEYSSRFEEPRKGMRWLAYAFYLPLLASPWAVGSLIGHLELDPLLALHAFIRPIAIWAAAALGCSAVLNFRAATRQFIPGSKALHTGLGVILSFLAAGLAAEYVFGPPPVLNLGGYFATFLMSAAVVPGCWVGISIFRKNFLELRVQRNLIYTIIAVFSLLIYLDVVRRVSDFLEWKGIMPVVVTESVMIFILVVLFEPAKKLVDRGLRAAFALEFEKVQKLSAEIHECAKQTGSVDTVKRLVEDRVPGELKLRTAELKLETRTEVDPDRAMPRNLFGFLIRRGDEVLATLCVEPVTSDLSGDQFAALQLLADQLSSAIELCQLITDKVNLERQLAEKAKMAFLGEMAAHIAHNVKNPLSSMKTVIQLLEEDERLPNRVRQDCSLVTAEIDRLNTNISQVLRYAKPARDVDRPADLGAVARRIVNVMRAEAERRNVVLELIAEDRNLMVLGGEEAASDILSNLIVNALEATPPKGVVSLRLAPAQATGDRVELVVDDCGPGISESNRPKIFQPFFTTRAGGTGLGLAIVARRVDEIAGAIECVSPLSGQGGSRFVVRFQAAGVAAARTLVEGQKQIVGS
jgi:signal transduction histidine kinase